MKHIMRQLNSRGDSTVATWDPENKQDVKHAGREFTSQLASGKAVAFNGTTSERMTTFDSKVEEIIIVPQIAGG